MKKTTPKYKSKPDLFTEAPPAAAAQTPGSALRLDGGKGGPRLSAGQQRFNRLLAKIDKLEGQVTEMQTLADAFRPLYQSTLEPLREEHKALMRRMALCLDERLQRKGLSPAQKRDGLEISLRPVRDAGGHWRCGHGRAARPAQRAHLAPERSKSRRP